MVKKLSEISNDTMLTVRIGCGDVNAMIKEDFVKSSVFLDRGYCADPDYPQVHVGDPIIANFDFHYAFECAGEEMYEDWKEDVINSLSSNKFDFEGIEETINKVFAAHPTYYEGCLVNIDE